MKRPVFDYKRRAKSNSYGRLRSLNSIKALVIHWTEGSSDTAKNEADYFATGNERSAGAHIFVDYEGFTSLSVPLKRTAWSVNSSGFAEGAYYGVYTNFNTISIELCGLKDISDFNGYRFPSTEQLLALSKVVRYLHKKCPNCKDVVRHYDIKKKPCPLPYVECGDEWKQLRNQLKILLK